ncbi:hypothetical protein V6N12_028944 [Hibiscus sabdariffa]|uniref:Retroviral polymerase SH3-like domain-containing protein n=1 Tax=Hibiscus sabdariffa TaxID=183260 RepID=A0ABR2F7A1_9ROSI
MARKDEKKGKKVAKSNGNGKTKSKGKNALKLKVGISKEGKCFHCDKLGHWKRNYLVYLEEVKKAKAVEISTFGKLTKAPFNGKAERTSDLLGLIHSDVCGPMNTQARGGFQYFITFTDDFSRYEYIYLMRHKYEALEKFKEFKNEVENQQVRSMMSHSDLLTSFWGHALETATFTLNRVPSKSVQKTPYEIWTGKRPSMSFMKVWGCEAYVKHQMSTKLELKSHKCTFVGYPKKTKGYYFFNPKENKVFVARTGVFLEREFLSKKGDHRNIELKEVQQEQVDEPEVEQVSQVVEGNSTNFETQPLQRSTRERHVHERYGFLITTHVDAILVD